MNNTQNPSLKRYAGMIIFGNIVFLSAALVFYNGHFNFWLDPFSNLGDTVNNVISARIFTAEMVWNGLIFLMLAIKFFTEKQSVFDKIKYIVCLVGSVGFFVGGFSPDDTLHTNHVVGMALAMASLWLLLNFLLFERRKAIKHSIFLWLEAFLQVPILIYASAYFAQIDPASYAFQKISLFFLCVVFYVVSDSRIGLHGSQISR